jgi:hypothetical protein
MTDAGQDLQPFVAAALRLAAQAGAVLLRHRAEAAQHPESKGQRRELVTAADRPRSTRSSAACSRSSRRTRSLPKRVC